MMGLKGPCLLGRVSMGCPVGAASNGALTAADLVRNVHEMGASLVKLLYHEKVLLA